MKLISISAFWNNSGTKGIGIHLTDKDADLEKLAVSLDNSFTEIEKDRANNNLSKEDWAKIMLDEVKAIANNSTIVGGNKVIKMTDVFWAMMNIFWLENSGYLKPDNFNGMMFSWRR